MESQIKQLKLNVTNIRNTIFKSNKELKKLNLKETSVFNSQQIAQKRAQKENFVEGGIPGSGMIAGVASRMAAPAMSLIDKLKEFAGTILLGILINNLPPLIEKVKKFIEDNKELFQNIGNFFKTIGEGLIHLMNFIMFIDPRRAQLDKEREELTTNVAALAGEVNAGQQDLNNAEKSVDNFVKEELRQRTGQQVQSDIKEAIKNQGITQNTFKQYLNQYRSAVNSNKQTSVSIPGIGSYQKIQKPWYQGGGVEVKTTDVFGYQIDPKEFDKRFLIAVGNQKKLFSGLSVGGTVKSGQTGQSFAGESATARKARESTQEFENFKGNETVRGWMLDQQSKNQDAFKNLIENVREAFKKDKKKEPSRPVAPGEPGDPVVINGQEYTAPTGSGVPSETEIYKGRGPKLGLPPGVNWHNYDGRDYPVDAGLPISVFVPGKVTFTGINGKYGNLVTIKHSNGVSTYYAHLSRIKAKVGDLIEPGKSLLIGYSGGIKGAPGSGNSEGPHLHFEVRDSKGGKMHYNAGDSYFRFSDTVSVQSREAPTVESLMGELLDSLSRPEGQVKSTSTGKVSWYGPGFIGNDTAYGEKFTGKEMTAASPTLPYGTMVKVTWNGKSVTVRINDKGPWEMDANGNTIYPLRPHPTRKLDLSEAAARKLGMINAGVVDAKIEVMGPRSSALPSSVTPKNGSVFEILSETIAQSIEEDIGDDDGVFIYNIQQPVIVPGPTRYITRTIAQPMPFPVVMQPKSSGLRGLV